MLLIVFSTDSLPCAPYSSIINQPDGTWGNFSADPSTSMHVRVCVCVAGSFHPSCCMLVCMCFVLVHTDKVCECVSVCVRVGGGGCMSITE